MCLGEATHLVGETRGPRVVCVEEADEVIPSQLEAVISRRSHPSILLAHEANPVAEVLLHKCRAAVSGTVVNDDDLVHEGTLVDHRPQALQDELVLVVQRHDD